MYPLPVLNPESTVAEVGEADLLRHLRHRIPGGPGVVLGVGDDAAVVETSALSMVTTDSLVEDVHFRRAWAVPRLLGRKALSINLSDIAAMAGIPRYALVNLCLPPETRIAFVDGFYDGLLERAAETGVSVVGGNLARTAGPAVICVTLIGQAPRVLGRAGARAGDLVVVTGMLGGAAAGLLQLAQGARLDEDRALAERQFVHAAIDLSDGLSGDLRRLCEASGVEATVDAFKVPVNTHAAGLERARGGDALALALHGGEDYQLLLAVSPPDVSALKDLAVIWDLPLAVVGEFAAGAPEVYLRAGTDRKPLVPSSHDHFKAALAAGSRGE